MQYRGIGGAEDKTTKKDVLSLILSFYLFFVIFVFYLAAQSNHCRLTQVGVSNLNLNLDEAAEGSRADTALITRDVCARSGSKYLQRLLSLRGETGTIVR